MCVLQYDLQVISSADPTRHDESKLNVCVWWSFHVRKEMGKTSQETKFMAQVIILSVKVKSTRLFKKQK